MLYASMAWTLSVSLIGHTSASASEWCELHAFLRGIGEQQRILLNVKIKNMKKIKLYIAASLDGYLARPDGDIEWLTGFPNPSKSDYGYMDFLKTIDIVIMGGRTFYDILAMDVKWPYEKQTSYIVTRKPEQSSDNIKFISENVIQTISELRNQSGKDIWIVGGGELIAMLLNENLIDEMILFHVPLMLGNGIRLFPSQSKNIQWELKDSKAYDSGILEVKYLRKG